MLHTRSAASDSSSIEIRGSQARRFFHFESHSYLRRSRVPFRGHSHRHPFAFDPSNYYRMLRRSLAPIRRALGKGRRRFLFSHERKKRAHLARSTPLVAGEKLLPYHTLKFSLSNQIKYGCCP